MDLKKQKIISIVAICIAVVALIINSIILLTKHNKNVENEITKEENITNILNENSVIENSVLEENFVNVTKTKANQEVLSIDDVNNENSKVEQAIEIAKNDWGGEENTVFRCENNKDSQGRYVVEVRDKQTLNAKCYYHINVETGNFEISE